ncbi:hypothetical protein ACJMK2_042816 [Sinanodonta woodiana]|uniref:Uncharacterized protein n=1 Tax=Sinanodonta woodiana TaxID=1069815 RepID=A0ABD3VVF3_SINWO
MIMMNKTLVFTIALVVVLAIGVRPSTAQQGSEHTTTTSTTTKDSCPCNVKLYNACICHIIESNPKLAQQMIDNYYRMLNSIIGNIGKK